MGEMSESVGEGLRIEIREESESDMNRRVEPSGGCVVGNDGWFEARL